MLKRQKFPNHLFLPYKKFGIELLKKRNNNISNNSCINLYYSRIKSSFPSKIYRSKSDSLFYIGKKFKKMALSNRSYHNYMNKYKKLTEKFSFKKPNISVYPIRKNPKFLPIKNYEIDNNDKNKKNNKIRNDSIKSDDSNNYFNFSKINFENVTNKDKNNNDDNTIKEKPYGFKFKDTRIIYDKSKLSVKSTIFRNSNSQLNLTNLPNQNFKAYINFHNNKKEKIKNKIFKYFCDGDFLQNQNGIHSPSSKFSIRDNSNNKENNMLNYIIKDNDVNTNFQSLFDMIKNIKGINDYCANKTINYNIKNYYNNEDYSFQIDIESLCLKFINQDEDNKDNMNLNKNSQKLYLPFIYLPIFYLLDYTSFKIFLSEIIYYNKENYSMEINKNDINSILDKYKNLIVINTNNKDSNKNIKLEKITYYCKEKHYSNIYDWIIFLNNLKESNKENSDEDDYNEKKNNDIKFKHKKNIRFKVKIIFPIVKFHIINKRLKIKKYLNKNLIIKLLKDDFVKWEKDVLSELFMNKKFRNILNSSLSSNSSIFSFSLLTKKIFIDRSDHNDNLISKNKYEFFITDTFKNFSHYLLFSPYTIYILLGNERKIFSNINLNMKDSINLNKYSKYWGYMNTLNKCMKVDKNTLKAYLDLNILEKDPQNFFNLKKAEKIMENIFDFDNKGFIKYKNNYDIEITLLNYSLVEIQINKTKLDKRFYKIPKGLLNILLSEKIKKDTNLNSYISEYSEKIIYNNKMLNFKKEEMEMRRKAFTNDRTNQYDEDLSTEKHKTFLSKNFKKLNSLQINSYNRYSNNLGKNKNLGGMHFYMSGPFKRSETNEKINMGRLAVSWKHMESLKKNEKLIRKKEKKFTVFHKKNKRMSDHKINIFSEKIPSKKNINEIDNDEREQCF